MERNEDSKQRDKIIAEHISQLTSLCNEQLYFLLAVIT